MKKTILLLITVCTTIALSAQVRLDVEGDAKILGKLEIIQAVGDSSLFIGANAGRNDDGNNNNTFVGANAGKFNIAGSSNAFFGRNAGIANTNATFNSFFGGRAGMSNITGGSNAFFGQFAGASNTTGASNAYFGRAAGKDFNNTKSTMLGSDAETTGPLDRSIAIGYNATVGCANCAVIGGTGVDSVNVGIGTTMPGAALHVIGSGFFGLDGGLLPISAGSGVRIFKDGNVGSIFAHDYSTGESLDLKLQQSGGNVGIGSTTPTEKLDVNGKVRIRDVPTGTGDFVRIDADGNLFRSSTAARIGFDDNPNNLITEQKELTQAKDKEIADLRTENDNQDEVINDLQNQVSELKSLVEKLLTQNTETPKSTSYVLPLEQKALLAQNQPNPFRENTLVDYFVPADVQKAHIQVTGVDGEILGQIKITETGKGQVTIQSKSYPAGTYFYSLVLDGQVMETKRMLLAR